MANQLNNLHYVNLPLEENVLEELSEKAKDWTIMHGATMKIKDLNEDSVQIAPFSIFPSVVPRNEFKKIVDLQTIFNELIHKVAHNTEFLTNTLRHTIQVDDFTGNLFKIFQTVMEEGITQDLSLGLLRSDYMMHFNSFKQVEINTIASSFAGLATVISSYNRYILEEIGKLDNPSCVPNNTAVTGLAQGMTDAWKMYGSDKSVIMFVVEDVTYNICDQRFHEFEIRRINPQIRVIRRSLSQIYDAAHLNTNKELIIDNDIVSVIYFRSGYEPAQYPSKKEWDIRLLLERSKAIKCPSIQYQLAGTKKVQQALANPGVVELFLSDPKQVAAVKEVFVGLYGLDFDELGNQAVQMALEDPEKFVLKPQREGGGNNIYGLDVRNAILEMKDNKERTAWILMDKIQSPVTKGYIVRAGGPKIPPLTNLVSEFGIYGVVIGNSKEIIINRQVGHMVRTKNSNENEGGVAAGAGALDGPYVF